MSDNFSEELNEGLKKVLYTGVGLAAVAIDAAGKAIDSLSKKGEETMQKNKGVSEEFKRKKDDMAETLRGVFFSVEKMGKEELEAIKAKLAEFEKNMEQKHAETKEDTGELFEKLKELSREELESIKSWLEELSKNWADKDDEAGEDEKGEEI